MANPRDINKNLSSVSKNVKRIYEDITREIGKLNISAINPNEEFNLNKHPILKKKIEVLTKLLGNKIEEQIILSIKQAWHTANLLNDELVKQFISQSVANNQALNYNESALKQFINRMDSKGFTLSDKVWKYTEQYKENLIWSFKEGLAEGKSSQQISLEIRQSLENPDKLFRRVRNANGEFVLSRAAKEYHPGRGVYRSSYKNAMRLAITETNMAYRLSNHERWMKNNDIVGIQISLGNPHTLNGKPFVDMCDALVGQYPKDFVFVGWHPQCRCDSNPIFKTDAEIEKDRQIQVKGGKPTNESENLVKDVPQAFKDWVAKNTDRMNNAKSMPYFLRDNQKYVFSNLQGDPKTMISISQKFYDSYDESIWTKAGFDVKTGGYAVYHKHHQFQKAGGGGQAEKEVGKILANMGKRVEYLSEKSEDYIKHADCVFDGQSWDIKHPTTFNESAFRNAIRNVYSKGANNAIFHLDNVQKANILRNALNREIGRFKQEGIKMIGIYYILNGRFVKIYGD